MPKSFSQILELDYPTHEITKKNRRSSSKPKSKQKLHIFLDIDSTITHKDRKQTDPRCKIIIKLLHKWGHKVYLISGRPKDEIVKARNSIGAQSLAVGENGGIIIKGNRVIKKLGDKKECEKEFSILRRKAKWLKIESGINNSTEIILKKGTNLVSTQKIIKDLNLNIKITPSKRFWHLHHKEIDKGYALNELIQDSHNKIEWNNTIVFGDSEIDDPMLSMAKYGYLVNNASGKLKKSHDKKFVLVKEYFEGVMEGIMKHEPRLATYVQKKKLFR